jgi:hypothetical protein
VHGRVDEENDDYEEILQGGLASLYHKDYYLLLTLDIEEEWSHYF